MQDGFHEDPRNHPQNSSGFQDSKKMQNSSEVQSTPTLANVTIKQGHFQAPCGEKLLPWNRDKLPASAHGGLQREAVCDQAPRSAPRRPRELGLDQGSTVVQADTVHTELFGPFEVETFPSAALASRKVLLSSIYSEDKKEALLATGPALQASGGMGAVCALKSSPEFSRFGAQFMYRFKTRLFFTAHF